MDHQTQFSRPACVGPFGKQDVECKTHVDDGTADLFQRKAQAAGMDRSKLLRNLIYLVAHGRSYDVLLAEAADRRMRLALGEGLEVGQALTSLEVRGEVSAQ